MARIGYARVSSADQDLETRGGVARIDRQVIFDAQAAVLCPADIARRVGSSRMQVYRILNMTKPVSGLA